MYLIFPDTRVIGLHFCRYSMVPSSFKFVQWAPKHASFLHQNALWPFKVIQGWFWYQSKARVDFLLVGHCDYGPILHRFWDTATYCLPIFATRLSFGALAPYVALEFHGEVNRQETRVTGISYSEDHMIIGWVVLTPACDGRADRQKTGRRNLYSALHSKLCWHAVKSEQRAEGETSSCLVDMDL